MAATRRLPTEAIARLVRQVIALRPCRFTVDHTAVTTPQGGRQGEPVTRGPYVGTLVPPGANSLPTRLTTVAGVQLAETSWRLLAPAHAGSAFGQDSRSLDYVQADGYGRFRVRGVRPIAAITPALGWIVGLDRES